MRVLAQGTRLVGDFLHYFIRLGDTVGKYIFLGSQAPKSETANFKIITEELLQA